MNGAHSDLGPELRALAQSILDKLDPAIRFAAARAQAASGPGRCQQVWCPVCALAAMISGEQHPLLDVVAEHSVALLTLLKAMVDTIDVDGTEPPPTPDPPAPGGLSDDPGPAPSPPGRYQHIPVTLEE